MLTALLLIWPVAAALLLHFVRGSAARALALGASLVELLLAVYAAFQFNGVYSQTNPALELNYHWLASAGINFHIGMDGLSLLLVLLTAFLVPLILLASFRHNYDNPSAFYALVLFMQTGLLGVFVAQDAFVFYFFWEVALIPIYFLAGVWGGERRVPVTLKFFIYTVVGSLLMLAGFVYLYYMTGVNGAMRSSDLDAFYNLTLSTQEQSWVFLLIFAAFAIKMPLFPLHSWQPDTYTEAPAPASMLLSGIMLKMGIYGTLRWLMPIVPKGMSLYVDYIMVLAVIGIIYGAIIAIRQRDVKRLIAFSSLSHVGLMIAGMFSLTAAGLQGTVIQMLAHGVNVVGMFFIADVIERRTGTRQIAELGGLTRRTPLLTVTFLVILLGTVALPLTNGFVGEFLLLMGVYQFNPWLGAVAGLTIIFGAVYLLRMFQRVMLGPDSSFSETITDLTGAELAVLVPLILMVFWIGLFPGTFMHISEPAVNKLLVLINR
jgi:NADH-quinone oxidoreductase subunit M